MTTATNSSNLPTFITIRIDAYTRAFGAAQEVIRVYGPSRGSHELRGSSIARDLAKATASIKEVKANAPDRASWLAVVALLRSGVAAARARAGKLRTFA